MKWLILTPEAQHKDLPYIDSVLTKDCAQKTQMLALHAGLSDTELASAVDAVANATHAVVLGAEELCASSDGTYLLGNLMGRNIPVFVCAPKVPLFVGVRASSSRFKVFTDIQLLAKDICGNLAGYTATEEKQNALTGLFAAGIPFTTDCFATYIAKDDDQKCTQFLTAGMLVDSRDSNGVPMLCIATRNDCAAKVKWLVEKGANINAVAADRGYTAVMDAVWRKNEEVTQYLIEQGADLSIISSDGQSILVLAVGNGNTKIIDMLLSAGADPDVKDGMGMSARQYAELFKKEPILEVFRRHAK